MASQPFHHEWTPSNWNEFRSEYLGDQGYLLASLAELTRPSAPTSGPTTPQTTKTTSASAALADTAGARHLSGIQQTAEEWTVRLLDSDHEMLTAGGGLEGRVRDLSRVVEALESNVEVELVFVRRADVAGTTPRTTDAAEDHEDHGAVEIDGRGNLHAHLAGLLRSARPGSGIEESEERDRVFATVLGQPISEASEIRAPEFMELSGAPGRVNQIFAITLRHDNSRWIVTPEEFDALLKDFVVFPNKSRLRPDERRTAALQREKRQMWSSLHSETYARSIQDLLLQTVREHQSQSSLHITLLAASKGIYQLAKFFRDLDPDVRGTLEKENVHLSVVVLNGGEGKMAVNRLMVEMRVLNESLAKLLDLLDPETMTLTSEAVRNDVLRGKDTREEFRGANRVLPTDRLVAVRGVAVAVSAPGRAEAEAALAKLRQDVAVQKRDHPRTFVTIEFSRSIPDEDVALGTFDLEHTVRRDFLGNKLIRKLVVTSHEGGGWFNTAFGFLWRHRKNRAADPAIGGRQVIVPFRSRGSSTNVVVEPAQEEHQHVAFYTVSDQRLPSSRHPRCSSSPRCLDLSLRSVWRSLPSEYNLKTSRSAC